MEYSDWYLRICFSTSVFGATFQKVSGLELVAFAHADYTSKATGRRSASGGAVMCAGACGCWFSKKCVTLSTTKAEYVALGDTIKGAMFSQHVWSFIFSDFGATCTTVFEDSEGARHLEVIPVRKSNSNHIDVRHCFLRERIFRGKFIITHVASGEQQADFLTKSLGTTCTFFVYHREFLMNN